MKCSFCCEPLTDDSVEWDKLPLDSKGNTSNLHLDDQQGHPFLHLHGECIQTVIKGLQFGERLVVN